MGPPTAPADRIKRPTVNTDSTEGRWAEFMSRWNYYKSGCGIKVKESHIKLLECCEDELKSSLFRNTGWENDKFNEEQLLAKMKQLAARAQYPLVNRVVLLNMVQAKHQGIHSMTERPS